jgi:D-alanine-D-alanine ligase
LYKKVEKLLKEYDSPVMIMEFIHGKEFTVGIIENGNIVLPVMEIDFSELPEGFHQIYSFEVKNEYKHAKKHYVPASISKDLEDKIKETALRAFKALICNRDKFITWFG